MVARISVIFKIKFSTSGVAHGDALLREELPQKNVFFRALPEKGGERGKSGNTQKKTFLFAGALP